MKRNYAFTLIELLIVIVIISILAAILFPALSSAREKARQSSCENNEKQIGLALMQYTQDYDETFPNYYWDTNLTTPAWVPQASYMPTALYPYTHSTQMWICPSQPAPNSWVLPFSSTNGNFGWLLPGKTTGYNMNEYLINDFVATNLTDSSFTPVTFVPVTLTNLDAPSIDIAIGEMNWQNTGGACDLSYPPQHLTQWTAGSAISSLRVGSLHNNGMNVIYCDGHVKWLNSAVYENPSNSSIWFPGYDN